MKKFIYKTNQYLLENHPIIWNTKIVWVLITVFFIHILFFAFGYTALTNPEMLHEYGAKTIFFESGTVFISIILSVLIIVFWLIFMFKNNAFKSFYPSSKLKLFKQFVCYLIIIFFSVSFFISFNSGVKAYTYSTYKNERFDKEVKAANNTALFFSKNLRDYTINQRRYPSPFNQLYCESYEELEENKNDSISSHLTFLNHNYAFYTLKTKEGSLNQGYQDSDYSGFLFYTTKDTLSTYYYKDSIYNIKTIAKSAYPSYYNYSSIFFSPKKELANISNIKTNYTLIDEYEYNVAYFSKENEIRNKLNYELLNRNNPKEIKQLLETFLAIAENYKIKNNITADKWFNLVYNPKDFKVNSLIKNEPKESYQFEFREVKTTFDDFYEDHVTEYYIDTEALLNVFRNIEDIKSDNLISESIHFFIWLSYFLSAIIFVFRITGVKPFIFTIISIGVLSIFIGLLAAIFDYTTRYNNDTSKYFISYLTLFIGIIVFLIPLFFSKKLKKVIVAVCLNISVLSFISLVFLIIGIISMHQDDYCRGIRYFENSYKECPTLISSLGIYWSYILFAINLLFIFLYSNTIKKWKALPEG